jgi:long-subunit fatty acid transport protein
MALVLGLVALPAAAQSMALPAADAVGISRSGAQVAYGYSLEAAATNPALLSSLRETSGIYLSAGFEASSTQRSLESTQRTDFSTDRLRGLGAFGMALRLSPALTLGLKLDEPYLRHSKYLDGAPTRFLGDDIDISTHRLEGQAAWAFSPNLSVGIGLGVARLGFESTNVMRVGVPVYPTAAVDGLVEQRVGESGNKVVPSYSLGLRWALNPRWTIGFTHQSGLKADLDLKAGFRNTNLGLYSTDGLSQITDIGTSDRAATLLANSQVIGGQGNLELPSQTTLGVRHRLLPMMTWEADLRWTSASMGVPTFASIQTPGGTVSAPMELPRGRSYFGLHLSSELELGKFWTLRGGVALDQRSVSASVAEPLLGGARTAAFSIGAGYKVWGGELNLGYQFRQSEDQDSNRLTGDWTSAGYQPTPVNRVRVEGMGHLMALGFKKTF